MTGGTEDVEVLGLDSTVQGKEALGGALNTMKNQGLLLVKGLSLVIAMFVLGASSAAFAQSADEGSNRVGPILLEDANGSDGSDPNALSPGSNDQGLAGEGGGTFPFTGLDVALLAAAAALLVIMGFSMRRHIGAPRKRSRGVRSRLNRREP